MKHPKIGIITAGGTIAGTNSSSLQATGYESGSIEGIELIKSFPDVSSITEIVQVKDVYSGDSTDTEFKTWARICSTAEQMLLIPEISGAVCTFGTDVTEEAAYFCQLYLDSQKPLVFTGAMLPATSVGGDGPNNYVNSIYTVIAKEAVGKGAIIVYGNTMYSASNAVKTGSLKIESFDAIGGGVLGRVLNGAPIFNSVTASARHTYKSEFRFHPDMEFKKAEIINISPDQGFGQWDGMLNDKPYGIVMKLRGDGTMPTRFKERVKAAAESGILVVRGTECVDSLVSYEKIDDQLGTIPSHKLSCNKARVLATAISTKYCDELKAMNTAQRQIFVMERFKQYS